MPHHADSIRSHRVVPPTGIRFSRFSLAALLTLLLSSAPALAAPIGAEGRADFVRFAVAAFLDGMLGTDLRLLDQLDEIGTYIDPDGAPAQQAAPPTAGPSPVRAQGS